MFFFNKDFDPNLTHSPTQIWRNPFFIIIEPFPKAPDQKQFYRSDETESHTSVSRIHEFVGVCKL